MPLHQNLRWFCCCWPAIIQDSQGRDNGLILEKMTRQLGSNIKLRCPFEWLQDWAMKNWMYMSILLQLSMIGNRSYAFNHLEETKESFGWFTLHLRGSFGRHLSVRSKFKQDPVSGLVRHLFSFGICKVLHRGLSLEELLLNDLESFIPILEHLLHRI